MEFLFPPVALLNKLQILRFSLDVYYLDNIVKYNKIKGIWFPLSDSFLIPEPTFAYFSYLGYLVELFAN